MGDLSEMSSRKTEYGDTHFLNADSPEETARALIGILEGSGFRPIAESTAREIPSEESPAREDTADLHPGSIRSRLECAPLVFAGGRGLHTMENLQKLTRLAVLYGAEYAVSRPLALEGFAPEERMIGVSGAAVRPKLLFAAGLSGSIQFMGGVKNINHVIVVNNNPNAQIFRYATEAVLADAGTLLDAMLEILEGNIPARSQITGQNSPDESPDKSRR